MVVAQNQFTFANSKAVPQLPGYDQVLRALGQALESQGLRSFEMTPAGNNFLVLGTTSPLSNRSSLRTLWGKLPNFNRDRHNGGDYSGAEATALELNYSLEDIQRFELEGRARRVDPHQMANVSSLSQMLRCLGAYLHQKRARLIKLTRQDDTVILEYVTSLGNPMKESFGANGLYDIWVRMYLQRADRTSQSISASESRES
ncbi:MAG TPA: hypothetical protein VEI95_18140 [Acidobacteriota bacterium]|nr:hypothetical protein [Acidobacteriota bacterium]